jgi:hypothetical protein
MVKTSCGGNDAPATNGAAGLILTDAVPDDRALIVLVLENGLQQMLLLMLQ